MSTALDRVPRLHTDLMPGILEEKSVESGDTGLDMCDDMSKVSGGIREPYVPQSHHHNESTSTTSTTSMSTLDSTGSSPTTTVSLSDDSSGTEMSPGSSPESPPMKSTMAPRPHTADERSVPSSSLQSFPDLTARSAASGKRARNLKNLAVNTSGGIGTARGAATSLPINMPRQAHDTVLPLRTAQAGFNRPPSPPKRKPSNLSLSIVTSPTSDAPSAISAVPPTPSLLRPNTLRHFQSSPALPLSAVATPTMEVPTLTVTGDRPVLARSFSDISSTVEDGFNFDVPQSREEKPEAYPDGPICVFEPYVDLYLEPTAEQASQYDVVLNVASEVRNPFLEYTTPDPASDAIRLDDGGGGLQQAPRRSRASSTTSNTSTKATSLATDATSSDKAVAQQDTLPPVMTSGDKQPEYIHIPWEHNTDIVSDLPRLVKLIDSRVSQGQRTLIHCQCGVSRSATLIVAYCMYKRPELSVQQAYDIVKGRSKWIGPNMNLIMQLQEFSSLLSGTRRAVGHIGNRSLTPIEASAAWHEWRRDASPSALREAHVPMTAPLLATPPDGFKSSVVSLSTPAVSPGPSSAPSGSTWPSKDFVSDTLAPTGRSGDTLSIPDATAARRRNFNDRKRPSSLIFETTTVHTIHEHIPPSISESPPATSPASIDQPSVLEQVESPRSEEFAMISLQPPSATSSEDTFGIMSPTSSSFSHSPLDRAALLGSLGFGAAQPARSPNVMAQVATGVFPGMQKPVLKRQVAHDPSDVLMSPRASAFTANPFENVVSREGDPRSPPMEGSVRVTRNIADAL